MKRILHFAFISILLLGLTVGCSDSTGGTEDEITFWAYEPESNEGQEQLEALLDEFEEETGVKVNITFSPKDDYNTRINSNIASGNNPDVGYLDQPLLAEFVADDILLNITEYAAEDDGINYDDFFMGALETAIIDGELYGLPMNQSTVALFYNKDLVPTPPTTWSEWLAISNDVYVKDSIAGFGGIGDGGWAAWLIPAFVHGAGGSMVNEAETVATFGEAAGLEAIQLLLDLDEYSDQSVIDSQNAFGNGMVATMISGAWEINGLQTNFPDLDFGVALIPSKDGVTSHSNIGGDNLVVFENAKNPEAAYQLIQFLTNEDNAVAISEITGNFPVRLNAASDPLYSDDEHLSVFLEQLENAVARPRISIWLKINDEVVGSAIDDVLIGGGNPQDVFPEAQERANRLIEEDNN